MGALVSLLTTCRLQSFNPCTYLVDVLQRISAHPSGDAIAPTPRVWKDRFASNPLPSDVDRHAR